MYLTTVVIIRAIFLLALFGLGLGIYTRFIRARRKRTKNIGSQMIIVGVFFVLLVLILLEFVIEQTANLGATYAFGDILLGCRMFWTPAPLVAIVPAALGVYWYQTGYRCQLATLSKEIEAIRNNYDKFIDCIGDEDWILERVDFLKEGKGLVAPWDKSFRTKCIRDLQSLENRSPLQTLLDKARIELERENVVRAANLLAEWLKGWERTRRLLLKGGKNISRTKSSWYDEEDEEGDALGEYAPVLDFVRLYPEDERAVAWGKAVGILEGGDFTGCVKFLLEPFGDIWEAEWKKHFDQVSGEFVLMSIEVESFYGVSNKLSALGPSVLQSEANQLIAERAPWGTSLRDEAIRNLRNEGQVGRRRVAFIMAKPPVYSHSVSGEKMDESRFEAYRILKDDWEAKNWLTQLKASPSSSVFKKPNGEV